MSDITDKIRNILIIGNGFDINLGLKTSYSDFLHSASFSSLIGDKNYIAEHLKQKHTLQNWIDIENELKNLGVYYDRTVNLI